MINSDKLHEGDNLPEGRCSREHHAGRRGVVLPMDPDSVGLGIERH